MEHQRKVIHVELKEPYKGQRHWYFGSAAAIYDTLPVEVVGIGLTSLWNVFCDSRIYEGKLATIRLGYLITHKTGRGAKLKSGG